MQNGTDPTYLRETQYRDAHNLDARVALHLQFSTNPYGWQRWLFEQLPLKTGQSVLELGCGPGHLWLQNADRLPADLDLTLSDFSPGMIQEAQTRLNALPGILYEVIDAQQIPYPVASFDLLIANHMLYHVPDRRKALTEASRVLKRRGVFCASTVGASNSHELAKLVRDFDPNAPAMMVSHVPSFTLQNGGTELAKHFHHVERFVYPDALEITQAAPLAAYVASGAGDWLSGERMAAFIVYIDGILAKSGSIHVTKESGVFICTK